MSKAARVAPASPPYPAEVQARFDALLPAGVAPLVLFRVLARDQRLFARFMGAGLLDKGHLTLRQREIVIDRVTARCGAEYEWGVHVAFFAGRAQLTGEELRALARSDASDPAWSDEESLLIQMVDELHDSASLSDEIWNTLRASFSLEQILELIALVGFYHTVAFFANALRLPAESWSAPYPPADIPP